MKQRRIGTRNGDRHRGPRNAMLTHHGTKPGVHESRVTEMTDRRGFHLSEKTQGLRVDGRRHVVQDEHDWDPSDIGESDTGATGRGVRGRAGPAAATPCRGSPAGR